MADPLCRWRYATPQTIVSLVRVLPKQVVSKDEFWQYVKQRTASGEPFTYETFAKTAYQLAVQVGLYYIDENEMYHPRFLHDIDEIEAKRYLAVVAKNYISPNPYAPSMSAAGSPVNIYNGLIAEAKKAPTHTLDVKSALQGMYSIPIGNVDAITALMANTPEFTKKGSTSIEYTPIAGSMSAKDFFDLFTWGNSLSVLNMNSPIVETALKLFAIKRNALAADIWPSFDEWAKDARLTFSVVDEHQIVDPSFDYNHFVRFVFSSRQRTAFSKFDDAQKVTVGKFLREERSGPHSISWYIDPANKVPVEGIGTGVMLYFMMMVKPEEFATWSGKMDEGLSILGLRADATPEPLTVASYEKSKSLQQVVLQKMHEMDIGKAADDPTPADYLTVNEFLWFVTANEKDIKNEVQKMKLTDPNPNAKNEGKKKWADVLSEKPDEMMNRLIAALLTKPFAILTGASGTGKSRMVRKLAYMTCLNTQLQPDPSKKKPIENFRMVQVKPNWHDSSELLGYKSAVSATSKYVSTDFVRFILKAHAFPETPFFVCLDEMNLAPVEHYFAEFLSASESARFEDGEWITDAIIDPGEFGGDINNLDPTDYSIPSPRKELIEKIGLFIPHNLFVVGTVNMDDSTSGFSRKVLDRAMTLEMDEVNYEDLQKPSNLALFDETDSTGKVITNGLLLGANEVAAFISRCQFGPEKLDNGFRDKLTKVKDKLHGTPLAVAHRFARESVQYREALQTLFAGKGITDFDEYAIDHMMLMKVLPRLEGNMDELGDLLGKLKDIFVSLSGHKISADKFDKMEIAAGMNGGYFSFYL